MSAKAVGSTANRRNAGCPVHARRAGEVKWFSTSVSGKFKTFNNNLLDKLIFFVCEDNSTSFIDYFIVLSQCLTPSVSVSQAVENTVTGVVLQQCETALQEVWKC